MMSECISRIRTLTRKILTLGFPQRSVKFRATKIMAGDELSKDVPR